jgi:hypothetical protein
MGTPFKMKGSPFQRNYGLESPVKQDDKVVNAETLPTAQVSGGKGGGKTKYNPLEESIQKETDIRFSKSLEKDRNVVLQQVRADNAKAELLRREKASKLSNL